MSFNPQDYIADEDFDPSTFDFDNYIANTTNNMYNSEPKLEHFENIRSPDKSFTDRLVSSEIPHYTNNYLNNNPNYYDTKTNEKEPEIVSKRVIKIASIQNQILKSYNFDPREQQRILMDIARWTNMEINQIEIEPYNLLKIYDFIDCETNIKTRDHLRNIFVSTDEELFNELFELQQTARQLEMEEQSQQEKLQRQQEELQRQQEKEKQLRITNINKLLNNPSIGRLKIDPKIKLLLGNISIASEDYLNLTSELLYLDEENYNGITKLLGEIRIVPQDKDILKSIIRCK